MKNLSEYDHLVRQSRGKKAPVQYPDFGKRVRERAIKDEMRRRDNG
jgi:hypothetical protein